MVPEAEAAVGRLVRARRCGQWAGASSFMFCCNQLRSSSLSSCPWADTACWAAAASTSDSSPEMVRVQPISLGKSRQSATFRLISLLSGVGSLQLFDASNIEVAEHCGLVAQRSHCLGKRRGLGEGRVGHGVLVGREL